MDDRNAQVGWTESAMESGSRRSPQAWQRVRVAGSFSPSTARCRPSGRPQRELKRDGWLTTERPRLLEIALPVTLSRQQI
jgi:hypothetical protein